MENTKKRIIPVILLLAIVGVYFLKQYNTQIPENIILAERTGDDINVEKAVSDKIPTIVYFGSECCSSNRDVIIELNQAYRNIGSKARLVFFNSGNCKELVSSYPITITPSQLLFDKNGMPFEPAKDIQDKWNLKVYYNEDGSISCTIHAGSLGLSRLEELFKDMGAAL